MDSKTGLGENCPFTSLVDTPRNQSKEQVTNTGNVKFKGVLFHFL